MTRLRTEIGKIIYNPVAERFEALVTFHDAGGPRRVAASFAAPITADFDRVANGLWQDALRGCALADKWTRDRARKWWQAHPVESAPTAAASETIAVALS